MVYLKSILVGLGAAVLAVILMAGVGIAIAMRDQPSGVGAVIGVSGHSALVVALVMFAVGFAWAFRRWSRK
jgi:ABC-type Fe3+ transport system permease subunit